MDRHTDIQTDRDGDSNMTENQDGNETGRLRDRAVLGHGGSRVKYSVWGRSVCVCVWRGKVRGGGTKGEYRQVKGREMKRGMHRREKRNGAKGT